MVKVRIDKTVVYFVLFFLVFSLFINPNSPNETKTTENVVQTKMIIKGDQDFGTLILNVCITDPDNKDIWLTTDINLFLKPGGGGKLVGKLSPCEDIVLEILNVETINDIEFYEVKYENIVGWQTKRLLSGVKEYKKPVVLKSDLEIQKIIEARKNYDLTLSSWEFLGERTLFNYNVDKYTKGTWIKLIDINIKNNNKNTSLDFLTVRVKKIYTPSGFNYISSTWGRTPFNVSDVGPGESKNKTIYVYSGYLSESVTINDIYFEIEENIPESWYKSIKEFKII